MNQAKPNHLKLTAEELARVERVKAKSQSTRVNSEWAFVGRFGRYFGWSGVKAIMNNEIDIETASMVLKGAEAAYASDVVDLANASYIANIASRSKKGSQIMKKGLDSYIKNSKVDS